MPPQDTEESVNLAQRVLGIKKSSGDPNYYYLLGFERGQDVSEEQIEERVEDRFERIDPFTKSRDAATRAEAMRLRTLIAKARNTLIDVERRHQYNAQLAEADPAFAARWQKQLLQQQQQPAEAQTAQESTPAPNRGATGSASQLQIATGPDAEEFEDDEAPPPPEDTPKRRGSRRGQDQREPDTLTAMNRTPIVKFQDVGPLSVGDEPAEAGSGLLSQIKSVFSFGGGKSQRLPHLNLVQKAIRAVDEAGGAQMWLWVMLGQTQASLGDVTGARESFDAAYDQSQRLEDPASVEAVCRMRALAGDTVGARRMFQENREQRELAVPVAEGFALHGQLEEAYDLAQLRGMPGSLATLITVAIGRARHRAADQDGCLGAIARARARLKSDAVAAVALSGLMAQAGLNTEAQHTLQTCPDSGQLLEAMLLQLQKQVGDGDFGAAYAIAQLASVPSGRKDLDRAVHAVNFVAAVRSGIATKSIRPQPNLDDPILGPPLKYELLVPQCQNHNPPKQARNDALAMDNPRWRPYALWVFWRASVRNPKVRNRLVIGQLNWKDRMEEAVISLALARARL